MGKHSLLYARWPAGDRTAWEELFRKGDVLENAGTARHWATATRVTNRHHYARWLAWLERSTGLDERMRPWERVTPAAVESFARGLLASVAPRTATSVVIGLKVAAKAMHPAGDWRWLMDLTNRLNTWAEPAVDRRKQTLPIERIHAAALKELDALLATPLRRIERVAYRDALIVLLLTAAPIRLRNLAAIQIGTHLRLAEGPPMLRLEAFETKNRQPLDLLLPQHVVPYIDAYLERVRPTFRPAPGGTMLWLGFEGRPLTGHSIYGRVMLVTERLLGIGINPHSFRACAATSLSLQSPDQARRAAPLLGHRYFSTTERHYVRACQLDASRRVNATLATLWPESRTLRRQGA